MKLILFSLSLFAVAVQAAPSESDKKAVETIVSYSGTTLGGLLECDEEVLYSQYREALSDAMHAYPNTDPTKVRALLRKIERQAEVLGSLGMKKISNPTPEIIEAHQSTCRHNTRTAKADLQRLDDFILK